jgi:hypothetical protein
MSIPSGIETIRKEYDTRMDVAWKLRQNIPRASLHMLTDDRERHAAEQAVDLIRQREPIRQERAARRMRDAAVLALALRLWEV